MKAEDRDMREPGGGSPEARGGGSVLISVHKAVESRRKSVKVQLLFLKVTPAGERRREHPT